jgi:hypothetical protein
MDGRSEIVNEHLHHVREPGPGELSYRGMGVWMVLPIPRAWRNALDIAIQAAPDMAKCDPIAQLLACGVQEPDGTITGGDPPYVVNADVLEHNFREEG